MQGKIERDAQQTAQMIKNAPTWVTNLKMGWSEDQALQTQVIQSKPNFEDDGQSLYILFLQKVALGAPWL
ncbi:MAG: hypothetical protein IPI77_24125 [Saprospiraceae bacterium]|nr:hypothetical protein [Saprospiraceae bacterium]